MKRVLLAALAWALLAVPVAAQWQVPLGEVPIGRGAGTGFSSRSTGISVAALKALTNQTNGTTVYVNGYSAAGDGGQGWFTFNAASAVADNGGTIIAPTTGSGRWLRNYSGPVNPDWFGAGDVGVVANSSAAFTAAISAASDQVQTTPGKTYIVSDLVLTNGISLNLSGSSLRLPAASASRVLTVTGSNSIIDCAGGGIIMPAGNTPERLIYFNRSTNGVIQNCNIPNAHTFGVIGEGTVNTTVQNNTFGPSDQFFAVVWFSNNLTGAYTGSITSTTLTITAVTYGAVAVRDTIYGAGIPEGTTVTAFGTGTGGIGTYTISAPLTVASENINSGPRVLRSSNVINNYFADGAIAMMSDGANITNNYFYNRAANGSAIGTYIMSFDNSGVPGSYYANDVTVAGNVIDGAPLGPLNDSDCMEFSGTNFTITGNTCKNSNRQGIVLHSVRGATVTGNTCENMGLSGGGLGLSVCVAISSSLGDSSSTAVTGNVVKDTAASPTTLNFCNLSHQNFTASFTGAISKNTLTVSGVTGNLSTGALVSGGDVAAGTKILGMINTDVYWISVSQTVASVAMTSTSPFTIHDVSVQGNTAENISGEFCPVIASGGGTALGANVLVAGNQGGTQSDAIGTFYAPSVVSSGDVSLPGSNAVIWGGRSVIRSLVDGRIALFNSAQSSFDLLQFGGATSSFPALKRSATALQARLADDSDFAPFQTADHTLGGSNAIIWSAHSIMRSSVDGNILLLNNAQSDFGLLQFGGSTSGFPGLKRSGAGLQARLADDSGFAALQASTFTGALSGNATTATTASAAPVSGITGLGTGVATALAVSVGSAGAPVVNGGALGTPSSGVGTNLTGTAASLTAGNATKLTTPRAISIGGTTGLTATGVNFDGSAAINPALTGTLAYANGGTNDTGTAWSTYTPTVTCNGATSLTTATITGRYKQLLNKAVVVQVGANISAVGTCAALMIFSFPSGLTPNTTGSVYVGGGVNKTALAGVPAYADAALGGILMLSGTPLANNYYATVTYEVN